MGLKRILHLADSPYMGGVTSHVVTVAVAFQGHTRYEVRLATFPGRRDDATLIEAAKREGLALHTFPMASTFDRGVLETLCRYVADEGIDLIHAHGYRGALICAKARPACPVITTCHGPAVAPTWRVKLWEWAKLRAMRRHPVTVACSEHVRQWLIGKGFDGNRVEVVHNGCAPFAVTDSPDVDYLNEAGLAVLYAGRLAEGKGLGTLLEALAGMKKAALVVAGDGPLRDRLKHQAAALGLSALFVGSVADMGPYYRMTNVVALPSRMEALPMTLMEAAACGKPVVATKVGGIPEIVEDGASGFLVDYGDAAQLREVLERCMDPALRETMGARAKAIWQERFTPERMADGLARVYNQALGD